MPNPYHEFARLPERLRQTRTERHLSLQDAADAINVPAERLLAWEDGTAKPGLGHLKRLALLYRTTDAALLGLQIPPTVPDPEREALLDRVSRSGAAALLAVQTWLAVLDALAELQDETQDVPQAPPDRSGTDLLTQLWAERVTAVRRSLPPGTPAPLSVHHPRLGTCLLLNGEAGDPLASRLPAPLLARLRTLYEEETISEQATASLLGENLHDVLDWLGAPH